MYDSTRRALLAAVFLVSAATASADPSQITIIVPYAPGGLSDVVARLTGKVMAENMSIPVIVENRPGANGVLGLQLIASAKPDGTTIGFVPASVLTVNPLIYKDIKVDTVKGVTMLTLAVTLPNVLVVNPAVPAKNVTELIAYLKRSNPTTSYGSMGTGSSGHLNGELLLQSIGVEVPHVPYKGSAPAMQDLVAGNIQMAFENLPIALPFIRSGKLRAIGVTSLQPSPQAPDIPPIANTIRGFEDNIWFGFVAPPGMPTATADKLREQIMKALKSDEITKSLQERGATTVTGTPEEMRALVVKDLQKWGTLIKQRHIDVN
jgi:tripartite-type tricarboxylate transporter receptor subunit TctC